MFQEAPNVNGTMELTDTQKEEIKTKLQAIRDEFTPTMEQPTADTFYLVSEYNKQNDLKINGDTAEMVLTPEQPTETEV